MASMVPPWEGEHRGGSGSAELHYAFFYWEETALVRGYGLRFCIAGGGLAGGVLCISAHETQGAHDNVSL